jgi:penicillin amidase
MFAGAAKYGVDEIKQQQHDVVAVNAGSLVARLSGLRSTDPRVEEGRQRLLAWDKRMSAGSSAAGLYAAFERTLWRKIAEARVPAGILDDYLFRVPFDTEVVMKASNAQLLDALAAAVEQQTAPRVGEVTFRHPLAITQAARRLFNVGPFEPGGYESTVNANFTRSNVDIGASFRQIADVGDWDRSVATAAPGQAEQPRSPHYSDLAKLWAAGEYFPLSFSEKAIQANAESTLTLRPQ